MDKNMTAVITGGGSGIGEAASKILLDNDYSVISIGMHTPDWSHKKFQAIKHDLLDISKTQRLAKDISKHHNVTHLIHNAGMILPHVLEEMSVDDLTILTNLHAGAAVILTQEFVSGMKENQFGRIIFNSSRASLGLETRSAYSYSKAGIIGMARTWALEFASHGITVNSLAPGPILTDNFWDLIDKDSPEQEAAASKIPVGRLGKPEDVARAIKFFADPENSFITGQTLYVCGGLSIASG
ncbi:MAG: SDR family oxidoreductase [Pseudomonadota bacterium]|nr:SDR family oxidoreductase [Pseudomonadota bacterium]